MRLSLRPSPLRGLVACALLALIPALGIGPVSAATTLAYPYPPDLADVSCPSATVCYAVGYYGVQYHGTILQTTNGARTWHAQNPGTSWGLRGISCVSTSICYSVGYAETTVRTANGGLHWADPHTPLSHQPLMRVSCPSATMCVAAGNAPNSYAALVHRIMVTTDGARHWSAPATPIDHTAYPMNDVACPSVHACYVVGDYGTILASHDGGRSWRRQSNPVADKSASLTGISCATANMCATVGLSFLGQRLSSIILMTRDGGRSWVDVSVAAAAGVPWRAWGLGLSAIACPTARACLAVGQAGTAIETRDGGHSWSDVGDTGHALASVACHGASFCVAVGNAGYIVVLPRHVQQTPAATATPVQAAPTQQATPTPGQPIAQATQTPAPAQPTAQPTTAQSCSSWNVSGAWSFTASPTSMIGSGSGSATLTQTGGTLSGSLSLDGTTYTLNGTIAGGAVTLTLSAPGLVDTTLTGTVSADGATIDVGQGILQGRALCATS